MNRVTGMLATLLLVAVAAASEKTSGPTLWVPAQPDSASDASEPAPLLMPGRPNPGDSARRDVRGRARDEFLRGLALERDHPGAAVVSYRKAVQIDPGLREANYRMGLLFNTRAQWAEAVKCFAAEVEKHPDHLDAARELGVALVRAGDSQRGIQQLELLSRRRPKDGRVWHGLGFAYAQAKRNRDAERALARAIALPPIDAEEHRDLGAVLAASGRPAEARAAYRRALAIAPRDPATWLNLGNLERRAGRPDSAVAAYRGATAADTSFTLGYLAEVQVLREHRRDAEAVDAYRRWLSRKPEEHGARLSAVELLIRLGRTEEALAMADSGLAAAPGAGAPRVIHGMALAGRGRIREALEALRAGQERFGGDPAEVGRVESMIAALRAGAPDSLRELFHSDSLRVAARRAARDSSASRAGRR